MAPFTIIKNGVRSRTSHKRMKTNKRLRRIQAGEASGQETVDVVKNLRRLKAGEAFENFAEARRKARVRVGRRGAKCSNASPAFAHLYFQNTLWSI